MNSMSVIWLQKCKKKKKSKALVTKNKVMLTYEETS